MRELTIQPQDSGKGRAFRATLVAHAVYRHVVPDGGNTTRPVFMVLAGTETALRPFVANLRLGRKAEDGIGRRGETFEVLKSAGYAVAWQRAPKGALVTVYHPELFCLDPGMVDPKGVTFAILPARGWLRPSAVPVPDYVPEDRVEDVRALAPLFTGYLDRRTRCPLIPDPRFAVQCLAAALDQGLAAFSSRDRWSRGWGEGGLGFSTHGLEDAGYGPGLAFAAGHESLETFLAEQVRIFYGREEAPESEAA